MGKVRTSPDHALAESFNTSLEREPSLARTGDLTHLRLAT